MDWDHAAQIGDAVGGFATLAGLLFAIISVNGWKEQARRTRRSEAAGEALAALITAREAFLGWLTSVGFYLIHYKDEPGEALVKARLATRPTAEDRREIERAKRRLNVVLANTAAHLTRTEAEPLREVSRLYSLTRAKIAASTYEALAPEAAARVREELVGVCDKAKDDAFAIERRATEVLGAVAQLADSRPGASRLERIAGVLAAAMLVAAILALFLK